jgi:hypothetical protein
MHHIALCTLCITHFNLGHLYAYLGRSRGSGKQSKSNGCLEVHKRQVAMMLTLL